MSTRTCSRCGTTMESPGDATPGGWSFAAGRRGFEELCDDCTRSNIRAIEAKLPEEYWEG